MPLFKVDLNMKISFEVDHKMKVVQKIELLSEVNIYCCNYLHKFNSDLLKMGKY